MDEEKLYQETKQIKKMIDKTSSYKSDLSNEPTEFKWNRRKKEIVEEKTKDLTFQPQITPNKIFKFKSKSPFLKQEKVHNRLYERFKEQNF